MNRAARLAPFILLAAALPAAAEKKPDVVIVTDRAAIAAAARAVEQAAPRQLQERREAADHLTHTAAAGQGNVGALISRMHLKRPLRSGSYQPDYDPDFCRGGYADCQMGMPGAPTLEQLRVSHRDVPQSELWNICLGNTSIFMYGLGHYGACAMLAAPDPLRPVELPYQLESGWTTLRMPTNQFPQDEAGPIELVSEPPCAADESDAIAVAAENKTPAVGTGREDCAAPGELAGRPEKL